MITACKAYITNNGMNSIWEQPQGVVVDKIKAAIHLNQVRDGLFCNQKCLMTGCLQTEQSDGLGAFKCVLQEYQRCFHKTKEKLEQTPNERQFDFSEMYIFGKFDTFKRRLNKILEMFSTISTYSALQTSKIEGLETMATRFQVGVW